MKAFFSDRQYFLAHGKAPRGRGSWAFRLLSMGGHQLPACDDWMFWVHQASYAEAKKKVGALLAGQYPTVKIFHFEVQS